MIILFQKLFDNIISKIKPPKKFKGIPKIILFIRNDRIGDAMVTLPILRDLKLNYPELKIDVLISKRNEFLFNNLKYVDDTIIFSPDGWERENLPKFPYKLFFIGHIIQFIQFYLIPSLFDHKFKEDIRNLKNRKYDAAIDLVGSRRYIFLSKSISKFTVGSKVFGLFWLYSNYINTNWVSNDDKDFMTKKIEDAMTSAFDFEFIKRDKSDFEFIKRDKSEPLIEQKPPINNKEFKFFIHLGGSEFRKFNPEKELELIKSLSNEKLLVTDGYGTDNFLNIQKKLSENQNVKFKLYNKITDILEDISKCEYLICYDGGQAHYLSQYIKTIIIFGSGSMNLWKPYECSGSMNLWKPYEFEEYELLKKFDNGVIAIKSKGEFGHIAIHRPMWCNPCFDIGCELKPCIDTIRIDDIKFVIDNYMTKNR